MRLHYDQHVPFEDLARIEDWAKDRGHEISKTLLFDGQEFPRMDEFDWLVVMGGPMNIYEDDKYPWLSKERSSFGMQLPATRLSFVFVWAVSSKPRSWRQAQKISYKEIGWYPLV